MRQGLLADQWPGRFEIIRREPWILLDGAHNGASMSVLFESVRQIFSDKKVTLLLALSSDKDFVRILKEIKVFSPVRLMVTEARTPRAFPCERLAAEAKKNLLRAEVAYSLKEALQELLPFLKKESVLLITGSFFLVAEAQSLFKNTPVCSEVL